MIPVYLILRLLASGYTQERVVVAHPGLAPEDILAGIQCTKHRMRFGKVHELPPLVANDTQRQKNSWAALFSRRMPDARR